MAEYSVDRDFGDETDVLVPCAAEEEAGNPMFAGLWHDVAAHEAWVSNRNGVVVAPV